MIHAEPLTALRFVAVTECGLCANAARAVAWQIPVWMTHQCFCPADLPRRCSASDQTRDQRGRALCCPYDEKGMAAFYRIPYSGWTPSSGRRAAMRKRLEGTLEEIAQRAADTRAGG